MDERPVPALSWFHVAFDTALGVHMHIQEANNYPGLRFHWTLNPETGERKSVFFIKGDRYDNLNDAIDAWKRKRKRKERVRLK